MIKDSEITEIGHLAKPHGINGEIVAITVLDADTILNLRCIILNIDGINVPFFLNSVRPKNYESVLISVDGITNEDMASTLCNNTIYALSTDIEPGDNSDEDGLYARDLVGFSVVENGCQIGEIIDIEDSTENALFIVKRTNNNLTYIPIADEFIIDICTDSKTVIMDLPTGIMDL